MANRALLILCLAVAALAQTKVHNLQIIPDAAHTTRGTMGVRDQADAFGFMFRAGVGMTADVLVDLPVAAGAIGDCLKLTGANALGFSSCGTSSGWTLSGAELAPADTQAGLQIVYRDPGQSVGSLSKPWFTMVSKSYQAVGSSGDIDGFEIKGAGALSDVNWRWAMSRRSDGRELWFYGYNGSAFSTLLKFSPVNNTVCIACSGSATSPYSLDVNGQILTTGMKARGAGGYVNAAQVEIRDDSTGIHFGWNATMSLLTGVPGAARYVTLQDASSNPILRLYSHVNGSAFPVVRAYGDVWPDNETRKLGASNLVWGQIYASQVYLNDINPRPGVPQIFLGGSLYPSSPSVQLGLSSNRFNSVFINNLDVVNCTGCGGGYWTASGTNLFPTSAALGVAVIPRPGSLQNLGSTTYPWEQVYGRGFRAEGIGGFMNASQIEIKDASTGLHFGWNATISSITGIPGAARYVTLQDASSNPIIRAYSHVSGAAQPTVRVYGDFEPDIDFSVVTPRKLGSQSLRWAEAHVGYIYTTQIEPRPGSGGAVYLGADLFPTLGTIRLGNSGARLNQAWVNAANLTSVQVAGLSGGGNAQACLDASGNLYRGTPGC